MKPNYSDLGLSICMGEKLRQEVERQLIDDLQVYGIQNKNIKFDWSDSCIEGHAAKYLDGSVENFSGIMIFDEKDEPIADGWMEFILFGCKERSLRRIQSTFLHRRKRSREVFLWGPVQERLECETLSEM